MKKLLFLLPILTLLFSVSCSKNDDVPSKFTVKVSLAYPGEITSGEKVEMSVTATNKATGQESVATVAADGTSGFELTQGVYNFSASGKSAKYNLNGLAANIEVYSSKNVSIDIVAGVGSTLILKEVYFTGVKSYYFLDAFYEIYNNTDEVQYLDGIILGVIDQGYAVGTFSPQPSQWMNADGSLKYNAYPMTSHVQYFPGTGKDHPVQPRSSIIVAANPIDHSSRATVDGDDKSPVNLSINSQWQLFYDNAFPADTKIEGVPTMEFAWKTYGREMMPAVSGQAIILARLADGKKVIDYVADPTSLHKHPSASSNHLMLPENSIIDAIDIVPFVSAERFKHIAIKDDAGMTWVSGKDNNSNGDYSGKSIRRKVIGLTADGKAIYKDTNNSSNDFIAGGQIPTPGIHPTTIDK